MSPIEIIKQGIISKDWDNVILGYKNLTGEDLSISEEEEIPSNARIKKVTKKKSGRKKKVVKELDINVDEEINIDEEPIPGPKSGFRSGPVNMKDNRMVFINQADFDDDEVEVNAKLFRKQKHQKQSRPKSNNFIKCPECKGQVHIFKNAKKFVMEEKTTSTKLKCPNPKCKHEFSR